MGIMEIMISRQRRSIPMLPMLPISSPGAAKEPGFAPVDGRLTMKKGWEMKKLGELCRIRTCKKDVNQGNPDGKFLFFTCAAEHTYSYS